MPTVGTRRPGQGRARRLKLRPVDGDAGDYYAYFLHDVSLTGCRGLRCRCDRLIDAFSAARSAVPQQPDDEEAGTMPRPAAEARRHDFLQC